MTGVVVASRHLVLICCCKLPGAFQQPEVFSLCDELVLAHLHLVGTGLQDGLWAPMQLLWGEKKICFDFQAEIVILFLENRAINSAYAKQTLCNVCIKLGSGKLCQKGMIFVTHLSESWEMLFSSRIQCLIFTLPASLPDFLLRCILIPSLESSIEKHFLFSSAHRSVARKNHE